MTELANKIRAIRLNKHIEFMLLGDPVKLLLCSLWGKQTDIPQVHQAVFACAGDQVRCNIWDLADNVDATCRMFPMDGTINTGFDYCIVVYDAITRIKAEQLDKWTTIKDQICSRQHSDRSCQLVVLVVKAPRTPPKAYQHIIDTCKRQSIHLIPVDNTHDGMNTIKSLLEKLANLVYQKRKGIYHNQISSILNSS